MHMYVEINVIDKEWKPASILIKRYGDKDRVLGKFAHYVAEHMARDLVKAIDTQRYKYKWAPLNNNYYRYKISHNLSPHIWEATGKLKHSIKAYRSNNKWVVGINPREKYADGVSVLKVARYLEYGTRRIPPRPLFTPIFEYYSKNINIYWRAFLKSENAISK